MPRRTFPKMLVRDLSTGDARRVSWWNSETRQSEKLWSPVVIISRGPLSTVHYAIHPERTQAQKFVTHNDQQVQAYPEGEFALKMLEHRLETEEFQGINQGRPTLRFNERR